MKIVKTNISDVFIIEPKVFKDKRGFFLEAWNKKTFLDNGLDMDFVQDNHSSSVKGTLRGLHYQTQNSQGKLVRVTKGEVFDVAVDLRKNSKTFGQWVGAILSAENQKMFWIPPKFAHGFYVISEVAEFQYKCTNFYDPCSEKCIKWDDKALAIAWPIENNLKPIVSDKDFKGLSFQEADVFE